MGQPVKRSNQRGNRHRSPTWQYRLSANVSRETSTEVEERERKVAEFIASRGVTRIPCKYVPLP